jgi:hypothetical protein
MPASGRNIAKWRGRFNIGAGDHVAADQILRLHRLAIGGEDELCLRAGGFGAGAQGGERGADFARRGNADVDVIALEDAARHVRLVGVALAQPVHRRFLRAERGDELEWELGGGERQVYHSETASSISTAFILTPVGAPFDDLR